MRILLLVTLLLMPVQGFGKWAFDGAKLPSNIDPYNLPKEKIEFSVWGYKCAIMPERVFRHETKGYGISRTVGCVIEGVSVSVASFDMENASWVPSVNMLRLHKDGESKELLLMWGE